MDPGFAVRDVAVKDEAIAENAGVRVLRLRRAVRDEDKYGRMMQFVRALPQIRRRVRLDLARPGLPREKVLAAVVRLLETTFIRVGNAEYKKQNHSYGLTWGTYPLRYRHGGEQ